MYLQIIPLQIKIPCQKSMGIERGEPLRLARARTASIYITLFIKYTGGKWPPLHSVRLGTTIAQDNPVEHLFAASTTSTHVHYSIRPSLNCVSPSRAGFLGNQQKLTSGNLTCKSPFQRSAPACSHSLAFG